MKFSVGSLLMFLAGITVVGLIVYAFVPQPTAVDLAAVEEGELTVTVDEDGKTRIKERYVVSSPLAGRLLRIDLDPGDQVKAGSTLIASVQPTNPDLLDARAKAHAEAKVRAAEAALRRAQPEVERTKVSVDYALKEFKRMTKLRQDNVSSQSDFEAAELEYRTLDHQHNAARIAQDIARFELEMAQAALVHASGSSDSEQSLAFKIHSPISGRVLRVLQESSTVLTAGTALIELGDPADLEVEVDVLSKDAVKIKPDAQVTFEQWGGDHLLDGKVRIVEPQAFTKISALGVEEQRVNVVIDFLPSGRELETLGDGYRVEARIVVWREENVLRAPLSALFRQDEAWAAFAVEEGKAVLKQVRVGQRNDTYAEVLEGLAPGDQVILHPSETISDGVQVTSR